MRSSTLYTERALQRDPGAASQQLFLQEKAFLSEAKASECIIYAHRFLAGRRLGTHEPSDCDTAEKTLTGFKHDECGSSNFSSQKIRNESELNHFLQDRWSDFARPARARKSTYVLFINRVQSRRALSVTRPLMESVLNYCHAFPHLKDFVTLYDRGPESAEREFHPPQCVFRELGSRKNGFECAYAFSHVDKDRKSGVSADTYWPIRRTAVYHRYSICPGRKRSVWIVIGSAGGSQDLRKQILDYHAQTTTYKTQASPFELHLLIQHCHMGNWRPRMRWLADEMFRQVSPALASPDGRALSRQEKEIQRLQQQMRELSKARQNLWEKIDDSILAVEALSETICLLKENFLRFEGDPQAKDCSRGQARLVNGFDSKKRQADAVLKQLKTLKGKAESTSSLYARLTALQSKALSDQGARNNRITTTLTMITASFLPTAVLGTFFSGTKIWDQQHGHAKYWGIIFGAAFGVGLTIYFLGILYSWWTFEDLAEGLRPLGGCCSGLREKRRRWQEERMEETRRAGQRSDARMLPPLGNQHIIDNDPGRKQRTFMGLGLWRRKAPEGQIPTNMTANERDNRALDAAERGSTNSRGLETATLGKLE